MKTGRSDWDRMEVNILSSRRMTVARPALRREERLAARVRAQFLD
jgi:hypothetical protein